MLIMRSCCFRERRREKTLKKNSYQGSFFKKNYLFIIFIQLCWVFIAAPAFLQLWRMRATFQLHCTRVSLWWLLVEHGLQGTQFSIIAAHGLSSCGFWALEHRLSSCDSRGQLLLCMWDPPGPGIKPTSATLAGGFFTTEPSGKPLGKLFKGSERLREVASKKKRRRLKL